MTGGPAFTRARSPPRWRASREEHGGLFRLADFSRQKAIWGEPLVGRYRDVTIFNTPPPTQGFTVLEMLNLVEPHELHRKDFLGPDHVHLLVQAKQIAYHDRDQVLADPAFADVPVERLISKQYAAERGRLIDRKVGIEMGQGAVIRQPVRRYGLCRRRRSRRQCGVADPKPVWRVRILRGGGKHRRHPAKPRRVFLARSATIPIASSPARSRCTR